jgi:hypothetical protein
MGGELHIPAAVLPLPIESESRDSSVGIATRLRAGRSEF